MTAPTYTPESVLSGATASLNLLRVASEKPAKYIASHKAQARPRKASTRSCVFKASQIREHSELQKREQHGCVAIVPQALRVVFFCGSGNRNRPMHDG